ncbi:MAG: AI-2E family transporter [Bacteroidales bacterium]|nr:AI-2E family transporter [Bacteroidales bacterium]MCF8456716.1 AI-2E family transporter [Bacteroidales bacterium]
MNKNLRIVLIALGVVLLLASLWYFKSIVAYLLIAAIISLIGQPLVDLFDRIKIKKFHLPRALSAALTLVVIWVLVLGFFRIFIPLVANQATELSAIDSEQVARSLEAPLEKLETLFGNLPISGKENLSMEEYVSAKVANIVNVSYLTDIFGFITGALGDLFIAIFSISFISFFFLKEKGLFSNAILTLTPRGNEGKMGHAMASIKKLLVRYFIGLASEVCLIIILMSLGLHFIAGLDFDTALVIGLFAGLVNVIPYVGPILGAAFGLIMGLITNIHLDFYSAMLPLLAYIALVFLIVQLIDNILMQPLIYSSSVNAHPLEIFLVIMIAGSMAGITGMVVAIPVYTILRVVGKEFFSQLKIVSKLTQNI